MNIGKLYDDYIAQHYDANPFGILSGGREAAAAQIAQTAPRLGAVGQILDLALGTGESLLAIQPLFPLAKLSGVDVAARMLELARQKFDVEAIHDDALNARAHFADGSRDLVLAHFVTTYVDPEALFRTAAALLRPGGHFSLVSGTMESFAALQAVALKIIPPEELQRVSPAPASKQAVEDLLDRAGFDLVAEEVFRRDVAFESFEDFHRFGLNSGFFTHVFDGLGEETVSTMASLPGIFPLKDQYQAAVLLARKR